MKILIVCTTDSMIWTFLVYHINKLKERGHLVECACSQTGVYFDELRSLGITMHKIPFERSPFKISNVKAYKQLSNLVKANGYELIFCHEPVGGAISRIVGKKNNCKIIYMAHGFHFYNGAKFINNLIFKRIEKYLSYKTDLIITINKEDYEASKLFGAKRNEYINGIGVDLSKFKIFETSMLQNMIDNKKNNKNLTILLSVGELIHRKNHEAVIKALAVKKNPNIHYFIAGEGRLREYLIDLTKKLEIENNVHFLGFCCNVNELCNSCDVFVFPSLQEGLSVAMMEAMSCGKPIICSNIRGNVDLVENGEGGIYVKPFDYNAINEAIEYLYNNKDICERMGKVNKKRIINYDIHLIGEQLINLIESI